MTVEEDKKPLIPDFGGTREDYLFTVENFMGDGIRSIQGGTSEDEDKELSECEEELEACNNAIFTIKNELVLVQDALQSQINDLQSQIDNLKPAGNNCWAHEDERTIFNVQFGCYITDGGSATMCVEKKPPNEQGVTNPYYTLTINNSAYWYVTGDCPITSSGASVLFAFSEVGGVRGTIYSAPLPSGGGASSKTYSNVLFGANKRYDVWGGLNYSGSIGLVWSKIGTFSVPANNHDPIEDQTYTSTVNVDANGNLI